jgi:hypothetical protein
MIFRFLRQKIVSGVVPVASSSLIGPAVDHLADLALWEAEPATDNAADAWSVACPLMERLRQVPDPRHARGLRHPLAVIPVPTACATLVVGNDSATAIRQWAARTPQQVLQRIGARFDSWRGRHTVPSERTFRRVLTDLDGDALDAALCGYATDVARGQAPAPVIPDTAGPDEREQRRAARRAVTHPAPAGCCPPPRSTASSCTGPSPAPGGCSWLRRSPTAAGSSWVSGRSPTNATRAALPPTCSPPSMWPGCC